MTNKLAVSFPEKAERHSNLGKEAFAIKNHLCSSRNPYSSRIESLTLRRRIIVLWT